MNNRQQNNNNNTHVPTAPTRSYNPNMVDLYDNSSPEMEGTHPSNSQIPQQSMLCGGILSGIGSVPPRAPPPPLFNSNNFALSMNNNDASPSSGDSEVEIIDNDVAIIHCKAKLSPRKVLIQIFNELFNKAVETPKISSPLCILFMK